MLRQQSPLVQIPSSIFLVQEEYDIFSVESTSSLVISISMMKCMVSLFEYF